MTQRRTIMLLSVVCALSACHTLPSKLQPHPAPAPENNAPANDNTEPPVNSDTAAPSAEEMPKTDSTEIPPCLPVDTSNPKPAPKRKPKPVVKVEPPPPAPVTTPPPKATTEVGIKTETAASSSILGRKVRGQEGDDLGRVVDVLADAQGRVRIAIIEFGGFLGVGNRRIAVEWSLLKFKPDDPEAPVLLDVPKQKLQGTPEYKGSERPLTLMGTEGSSSPRPATNN